MIIAWPEIAQLKFVDMVDMVDMKKIINSAQDLCISREAFESDYY